MDTIRALNGSPSPSVGSPGPAPTAALDRLSHPSSGAPANGWGAMSAGDYLQQIWQLVHQLMGGPSPAPEGPIPFFEQFLEGQRGNTGDAGQPSPPPSITMAYPSDSDLDTGRPDGNTGDAGQPSPPPSITMVYPSDSDADTGRPGGNTGDAGRPSPPPSITMVYPSDSDADTGRTVRA